MPRSSPELQHARDPVLRWCFSNVAIHKQRGQPRLHKGKSTDRIDGAVGNWMARVALRKTLATNPFAITIEPGPYRMKG